MKSATSTDSGVRQERPDLVGCQLVARRTELAAPRRSGAGRRSRASRRARAVTPRAGLVRAAGAVEAGVDASRAPAQIGQQCVEQVVRAQPVRISAVGGGRLRMVTSRRSRTPTSTPAASARDSRRRDAAVALCSAGAQGRRRLLAGHEIVRDVLGDLAVCSGTMPACSFAPGRVVAHDCGDSAADRRELSAPRRRMPTDRVRSARQGDPRSRSLTEWSIASDCSCSVSPSCAPDAPVQPPSARALSAALARSGGAVARRRLCHQRVATSAAHAVGGNGAHQLTGRGRSRPGFALEIATARLLASSTASIRSRDTSFRLRLLPCRNTVANGSREPMSAPHRQRSGPRPWRCFGRRREAS